jgi:hypothetical protein
MGFEYFSRYFVVLRYCAVDSEENRCLLCRQPCATQRAFDALDPYTRYIRCIRHADHDTPRSTLFAKRTGHCVKEEHSKELQYYAIFRATMNTQRCRQRQRGIRIPRAELRDWCAEWIRGNLHQSVQAVRCYASSWHSRRIVNNPLRRCRRRSDEGPALTFARQRAGRFHSGPIHLHQDIRREHGPSLKNMR